MREALMGQSLLPVWCGVPLLLGVGVSFFWWLTSRVIKDRRLCTIVTMAYSGRILLALLLFASALWSWPMFRSLQRPGGFWAFALDSEVYHWYGSKFAQAWTQSLELPPLEIGIDYAALVAAIYRVVGTHPLYAIMVNCWLSALVSVLAYLLAKRLFDGRIALWAAGLTAFWPSSWLWSSQLLKDPLCWCLIFTVLWLHVEALAASGVRAALSKRLGLYLLLAATVWLLTRCRFYIGSSLSVASLLVVAPAGLWALRKSQITRGLHYGALVLVTLLAMLGGRSAKPLTLFMALAKPHVGSFNVAVQLWQLGDLAQAEAAFQRSLQFKESHQEARLGLVALQASQGKLDQAIQTYTQYLESGYDTPSGSIDHLLGRLYLEEGDREFAEGRLTESVSAYHRALAVEPSLQADYIKRGVTFARRQHFLPAITMLEQAQTVAEPASSLPLTTLLARISREQADYELAAGHAAEAIAAYQAALEYDASLPLVYGRDERALPPDRTFTRLTTLLEERLATPAPAHQQLTTLAARVYVEHGDHARAAGRVGEAIHGYARATTLVPFSGLVAVKYALALAKVKAFPEALAALERIVSVVRTESEREQITRLLARLWIEQGDHELAARRLTEAVSAYGRGLKLDPSLQPIYVSRGIMLAKLRQFRLAIGMLEALRGEAREEAIAAAIEPEVFGTPLATVVPPPAEADRIEQMVSPVTVSDPSVAIALVELPLKPPASLASHDSPPQGPPPSPDTAPTPQPLVVQVAREMTPPSLDFYRQGFIASGGFSLVDPSVRIETLQKLLTYLPRGLALGLLAPFPWQWFETQGSTGVMRSLAGVEVAVVYLLLPGLVMGVIRLARQRRLEGYFFLAAVGLMAISMALVVANLGTLFRLRLQFLLPLLLCAAGGSPLMLFERGRRGMTAHRRRARFTRNAQRSEEDRCAEVLSSADGN